MVLVIQSLLHNLLYIIIDELKVLLTVKYIPLIVRWLATLQRHGAAQEHLTRLIDLKQHISKTLKDLDVLTIHRIKEDGMIGILIFDCYLQMRKENLSSTDRACSRLDLEGLRMSHQLLSSYWDFFNKKKHNLFLLCFNLDVIPYF